MGKSTRADALPSFTPIPEEQQRIQMLTRTMEDVRANPLNMCTDALTAEGREAMQNALSRRPLEGAFVQ